MRTRLIGWHASLAATLGLVAAACGGISASETSDSGGGGTGGDLGGSGGTPTSGAAGSGGSGLAARCTNPVPVSGITGDPTGFVSCNEGFVHRTERRDCASRLPRADRYADAVSGAFECATDADCGHVTNGYCMPYTVSYPYQTGTHCLGGCLRDEECGPSAVCVCDDPVGRCVSASCATDADCGDALCTSSAGVTNPCTPVSTFAPFACQSPMDACRSALDCGGGLTSCQPSTSGRHCIGAGACGRPFLVAGEARVAPLLEQASGWASERCPLVEGLDPGVRAEIAEHWSRNALMEHASVAAFARFTLDLLALGAPAKLLASAQGALGDEIEHAEICFGLASAYAGRTLGPGRLSPDGVLGGGALLEVAGTAILEACIGETLATAEALEAARHATDPVVRSALARIADDESRHAELGWHFLRWALDTADRAMRVRILRLLTAAVARSLDEVRAAGADLAREAAVDPESSCDLLAHGVSSPRLRQRARLAALELVVEPLARGFVDSFTRGDSISECSAPVQASFAA